MKNLLKRSIHAYYESRLLDSFSKMEMFDAILGLSDELGTLQSAVGDLYDEKTPLLNEVDALSESDILTLQTLDVATMQDDELLDLLAGIFTMPFDRQKQAVLTAVRNVLL